MARKSKTPVLPGLSRSAACAAKLQPEGLCGRLVGHHGDHRSTLASPKATKAARPKAAKVTRRSAPKVLRCRISKNGLRCQKALGHKAKGLRHRFTLGIVELPEVGPKGRDVQPVKGRVSRRSRYTTSSKPSSRLA